MTPQVLDCVDALVLPIDRPNVDTDAIIPKQFMKSIRRTGFGDNLFDEWRYLDRGEPGQPVATRTPNPQSVLNQPRYAGAGILLARENFGCGSSREHAPWALRDFGIRALIAPSFADIFRGNCLKNNILPVTLSPEEVDRLFQETAAMPGYRLRIDVADQTVRTPAGRVISFDIEAQAKQRLLLGLDDIAITLRSTENIQAFEARRASIAPWLCADLSLS
ncbi:3-isopropylmalate dehydratase small subunit [Pantoea sp. 18069]|uniref:3-isopropylmalate dehydratase small subunit n=1 Tax=Pantoea sp. 18069 TaxID=2681415 RepID=UPI001356D1B2|nr:3-isopropylmalate dehydratase small subunit [Pantoea sp. 18069]